ncbi:EAL domain-containing protein [Corallincola spongiicola]|uniref:EAL domain-containing protein n=1 Tax=Corallincola spongiicola TaxID=2520508 RepID=A0ABY1WR91_9GAMM|nr:EAL domain-containing protein [Corallincola spongiicola]TAA47234.1 EAL domain-containing protein [Corallincola spongiicola]
MDQFTPLLRARTLTLWLDSFSDWFKQYCAHHRLSIIFWDDDMVALVLDHREQASYSFHSNHVEELEPPLPWSALGRVEPSSQSFVQLENESASHHSWLLKLNCTAPLSAVIYLETSDAADTSALQQVADQSESLAALAEIQWDFHVLQRQQYRMSESPLSSGEVDLLPIIEHCPALISAKDLNGNILFVNRHFALLDGPSPEEYVGKNVFELFPKKIASELWSNDLKAINQGGLEVEETCYHKGGKLHTYLSNKFPLKDSTGEIFGICAISTDITERKATELHLRESEQRLKTLLRYAPEAILIFDVDKACYIDANRNAEKLFGLNKRNLMTADPATLSPSLQSDKGSSTTVRAQMIQRTLNGEVPHFEWLCLRHGSEAVPCEVRMVQFPMSGRRLIRESFIDISSHKASERKLKEHEAHLEYLAHHDALTGLPNRLLLADRLEHSLALARRSDTRVALLLFDLDRFKYINDTLGHDTGDRLLKTIANRLSEAVRTMDTAARLGGDEFVVLLEQFGALSDVSQVARKLIETLGEPCNVAGHELSPSLSIGISVFPDDASSAESLLKHADIAMYKAKESGGRHFRFFTGEMDQRTTQQLKMESELRQAIINNELSLVYQPQLSLADNTLCGMEVLVRWHHPKRGIIYPGEFIPVAEETGLINDLGLWVMRHTCKQIAKWRKKALKTPRISINLSARQFHQHDLLAQLKELLQAHQLTASDIEFEMTESMLMADAEETARLLNQLAKFGISLAVDDFGTGYSSLAYLQKFPIHRLKIDRRFIQHLPDNGNDSVIVSTIIAMAHNMGMKVVAEGVETGEQQRFLARLKCDEAQGYLFAKPLPTEACADYLKNHQAEL